MSETREVAMETNATWRDRGFSESLSVDDLLNVETALEVAPRLHAAETIKLMVRDFCPRDQILILDPNDPFGLGEGGDEIWVACHPDRQEEAQRIVDAAQQATPGGDE